MSGGRRLHPAWGLLLAALGLALLWWAGFTAGELMPAWGEAEPRCVLDGTCSPADVDARLRDLWGAVTAGAVAVLLGIVLFTRCLSPARPEAPSRGVLHHAATAGLVAGLVVGALGIPALAAIFISPHAVVAGLATLWLAPSAAHAWVAHLLGTDSARRSWLTALLLTPFAAVVTGVLVVILPGVAGWMITIGVAYGAVVAGLVAVVRTVGQPATVDGPSAAPRDGPAGSRVLVTVLLVVTVVAVASGVRTLVARIGTGGGTVVPPTAAPPTESGPAEPPPVTPAAPTTPPPVVEAAEPCGAADLTFAVPAFDAAMGARAASLQATNVSATPCWVEGPPQVTLLQGGRPLDLTVGPGESPSGGPAEVSRVGIAPGGSAVALLTWRTYAGWADAETPQSVTVALDAAAAPVEATVVEQFGPAPFDIADGGEWGVAPWAPPWN